ncbi:MAG: thiamine phosphate synthase, partial [Proteobacteria bacterium]|nr:thiamine phosphate synthase [Pseudomonadota bacterium]
MNLPGPPLLIITDRHQARAPLAALAGAAFRAGGRWLMLREKDLDAAARLALLKDLIALGAPYGAAVTVNADLAAAAGAFLISNFLRLDGTTPLPAEFNAVLLLPEFVAPPVVEPPVVEPLDPLPEGIELGRELSRAHEGAELLVVEERQRMNPHLGGQDELQAGQPHPVAGEHGVLECLGRESHVELDLRAERGQLAQVDPLHVEGVDTLVDHS